MSERMSRLEIEHVRNMTRKGLLTKGNVEALLEEVDALKDIVRDLRFACASAVRRIEQLNVGGMDEPDPTVEQLNAAIKKAGG